MSTEQCLNLHRPRDESLRAALRTLLQETRAYKPNTVSPAPVRSCWHTRAIVKEIRALYSVEALIQLEKELRLVLHSQEVRQRSKVKIKMLCEECTLEEFLGLKQSESTDLEKIIGAEIRQRQWYRNLYLCQKQEIEARGAIFRDFKSFSRYKKNLLDQRLLLLREKENRLMLKKQEALEHTEILQRRLIEVGYEVQLEVKKQSASGVLKRAHKQSLNTMRAIKALCLSEERDRFGIEKICFIENCNITYQAQQGLCHTIRNDLLRIAHLKSRWKARQNGVYVERCIWRLIDQEETLRLMLVRQQDAEFAGLYTYHLKAWRTVPHILRLDDSEVVNLVCTVEMLERKYLNDEYRENFRHLVNQFFLEKLHIQQVEDFLKGLTESLFSLWREEEKAFEAIHFQYHSFLTQVSSLPSLVVVELDEIQARESLCFEEITKRTDLKACFLQDSLWIQALTSAQVLTVLECNQRNLIMRKKAMVLQILPRERLEKDEAFFRLSIEFQEKHKALQLYSYIRQHMRTCMVTDTASALLKEQQLVRSCTENDEVRERYLMSSQYIVLTEQSRRERILRFEAQARTELRSRHEKKVKYTHCQAFAYYLVLERSLFSNKLHQAEMGLRMEIEKLEESARELIAHALSHDSMLLRALEADEVRDRLSIIYEAELTIRACVYGAGDDTLVQYTSEDLRQRQADSFSPSLVDVILNYQQYMMHIMEPNERRSILAGWENTIARIHLIHNELTTRNQLLMDSIGMLNELYNIFVRNLPAPNTTDATAGSPFSNLHDFLMRSEPSLVAFEKANSLNVAQCALQSLLEELYFRRDKLLFEEFVTRRQLRRHASLPCRRAESVLNVRGLRIHLHSVVCTNLCIGDEYVPEFVSMWNSDAGLSMSKLKRLYQHRHREKYSFVAVPLQHQVNLALGNDEVIFFSILNQDNQVLQSVCFLVDNDCYERGFAIIPLPQGGCVFRVIFDI